MTVYARPGAEGSLMSFESRYDNFIGGEWVPPAGGAYFENRTPVTGQAFCEIARSTEADIEKALDAAHAAAPGWGKTSPAERAVILNKIADRIEANLEAIALAETWDNGKPIRETLNADMPLAVDHFRYFAGAIRAQEGSLSPDRRRHRRLPLPRAARRGRADHSVELPDPDGDVEAGAGAGRRQLRRAQAGRADPGVDPVSDGADRRPAAGRRGQRGQRLRRRGGQAAGVQSNRIAKIAFTGETTTGRLIMQYAVAEPDPGDPGARRQEPEHLLRRRHGRSDDDFQDKALEGFTMFALNQGEVCTCPSRALIQADIYDEFLTLAAIRTKAVRQGDPLDTETMIGAQASNDQLEKILSYIEIGKSEGAKVIYRR